MDNIEKNIEVERPTWGLKKVICLNFNEKDEKEFEKNKDEINKKKLRKKTIFAKYQKKFGISMVVKIEFSLQTMFVLLCKYLLI